MRVSYAEIPGFNRMNKYATTKKAVQHLNIDLEFECQRRYEWSFSLFGTALFSAHIWHGLDGVSFHPVVLFPIHHVVSEKTNGTHSHNLSFPCLLFFLFRFLNNYFTRQLVNKYKEKKPLRADTDTNEESVAKITKIKAVATKYDMPFLKKNLPSTLLLLGSLSNAVAMAACG